MHTHKITAKAGDQSVILTVVLAAQNPTSETLDVSIELEIPIGDALTLRRQLDHVINQQARKETVGKS